MKTLSTIATVALLALTTQTSTAMPNNNSVFFKTPAMGGSGCPNGTTSSAVSPDGKSLSILFDGYIAEPGNKSCNIAIPVHVPPGFQVSTVTADYRGFVEGRAELRRSYFFAGQRTRPIKSRLYSRYGDDYLERDNLRLMSHSWSRCGQDVNMRVNTRIRTRGRHSSVSVDSLDLNTGMIFQLQYRRCR